MGLLLHDQVRGLPNILQGCNKRVRPYVSRYDWEPVHHLISFVRIKLKTVLIICLPVLHSQCSVQLALFPHSQIAEHKRLPVRVRLPES